MARRILRISETISREGEKYRAALASGSPPGTARAILRVIERLVTEAETLLPDPEIVR
jgi:hypothetical protein